MFLVRKSSRNVFGIFLTIFRMCPHLKILIFYNKNVNFAVFSVKKGYELEQNVFSGIHKRSRMENKNDCLGNSQNLKSTKKRYWYGYAAVRSGRHS